MTSNKLDILNINPKATFYSTFLRSRTINQNRLNRDGWFWLTLWQRLSGRSFLALKSETMATRQLRG
jgi:hypothetical protein